MKRPIQLRFPLLFAVSALLLCSVVNAQPLAPQELVANPADKQATLTWADPENPEIVRYELRKGGNVENLDEWTAIVGSDAGTVEHVASGLANGERHYFELRTVAGDGAGPAAAVSIALAAVPDATVDMADPLLRTAFTEALGKEPDAELTQGEMATIRSVFAEGWEGVRIEQAHPAGGPVPVPASGARESGAPCRCGPGRLSGRGGGGGLQHGRAPQQTEAVRGVGLPGGVGGRAGAIATAPAARHHHLPSGGLFDAGASPLFGYVDPGSAGFIIVSILGFLAAAGYTIRMHFAKLKDRVRKALGKSPCGGEDAEPDAAADGDH